MPGDPPREAARPSRTRIPPPLRTRLRPPAGRVVGPAALATVVASAAVAVVLSGAADRDESAPAARASVSGAVPGSASAAAATASRARRVSSLAGLRRESASRSAARPSRSGPRVTLAPKVTGHRWSTDHLNLWLAPHEEGERAGIVDPGRKLAVTGRTAGKWAQIVMKDGQVRWVNADYLDEDKPEPAELAAAGAVAGAPSSAPCPDGSGIESGITSTAVGLYRAACAAFPALSTYGGYDPHGEHADGRAIDFMTGGDSGLGAALAEWARANASALGLRNVIWSQTIWTPERAGEGWRYMSDRGSTTANHYDHVHIAVY